MGIIGNSRQASKSWLNPSESETRKETSFTEQNIPLMRTIKKKKHFICQDQRATATWRDFLIWGLVKEVKIPVLLLGLAKFF